MKTPSLKKPGKLIAGATTVFLGLLYANRIGNRLVIPQTDTYNYVFYYLNPHAFQDGELGFLKLMNLFRELNFSYREFLIYVSLITVALFLFGLSRIFSPLYFFISALLTLTSPFFYALNSNVIRQGLAVAIIIFSVSISMNLKPILKIPIGILSGWTGAMFHLPGTLIMAPLYLFVSRSSKNLHWLWLVLAAISYFSYLYSSFIPESYFGNYSSYLSNDIGYKTGFRIEFLLFSLPPFLMKFMIKQPTRKFLFFLNSYFLINGFALLFNYISYFDRFLLASWILQPIIYTLFIEEFILKFKNKDKYIVIIMLTIFLLAINALVFTRI